MLAGTFPLALCGTRAGLLSLHALGRVHLACCCRDNPLSCTASDCMQLTSHRSPTCRRRGQSAGSPGTRPARRPTRAPPGAGSATCTCTAGRRTTSTTVGCALQGLPCGSAAQTCRQLAPGQAQLTNSARPRPRDRHCRQSPPPPPHVPRRAPAAAHRAVRPAAAAQGRLRRCVPRSGGAWGRLAAGGQGLRHALQRAGPGLLRGAGLRQVSRAGLCTCSKGAPGARGCLCPGIVCVGPR